MGYSRARAGSRHLAPRRSKAPTTRILIAGAAITAIALPTASFGSVSGGSTSPNTTATTAAVTPTRQILLGADGNADELAAAVNYPLARHLYRSFSSDVPEGSMFTLHTGLTWHQVATMQPGSQVYNDVVRWANVLKGRSGRPLVAFSHEPELSSNMKLGGPQDFIAAFRKIVTVMRAQGATNVRYTWQMTGWSFRARPTTRVAATNWYPGDAYVDVVGPDEYNWYTCGEGFGRWKEFSELASPALAFAKAHGKMFSISEFASYRDARRTDWLKNAQAFLEANKANILAAFYFQYHPTNAANSDCVWALNQRPEYDAFGAMARDADFTH